LEKGKVFDVNLRKPHYTYEILEELMNSAIDWLMNGPAWLKYRTLIDLKDTPLDSGLAVTKQ